jgi:hypothetical protein
MRNVLRVTRYVAKSLGNMFGVSLESILSVARSDTNQDLHIGGFISTECEGVEVFYTAPKCETARFPRKGRTTMSKLTQRPTGSNGGRGRR